VGQRHQDPQNLPGEGEKKKNEGSGRGGGAVKEKSVTGVRVTLSGGKRMTKPPEPLAVERERFAGKKNKGEKKSQQK